MIKLEYSAITDVGKKRKNNEDNFYAAGSFKQSVQTPNEETAGVSEQSSALFSVCDGMGGASYGEVASLIAVSTLSEFDGGGFCDRLEEYIDKTNEKICAFRAKNNNIGVGATFTALSFDGYSVTAANIGDSRIYKYSGGILKQLSSDHTEAQMLIKAGAMKPEEAKTSRASHILTQSLGLSKEELTVRPYVYKDTAAEGDIYLLCSDGLTDMLEDDEIAGILNKGGDLSTLGRCLVEAALNAGGSDNTTVVLVRVAAAGDNDAAADARSENRTGITDTQPYMYQPDMYKKKKSRLPVIIAAAAAAVAVAVLAVAAIFSNDDKDIEPEATETVLPAPDDDDTVTGSDFLDEVLDDAGAIIGLDENAVLDIDNE